MELTKEELLFFRHITDLAKSSCLRDMDVFSDFMSVRETAVLKSRVADLPCGRFFLFGGVKEAERQMVCFMAEDSIEEEIIFPIDCVKVTVKGAKFISKLPAHKDYLGSVLGLGIERRLIGDIFLSEEGKEAYVLCVSEISDFLLKELHSVGNKAVEVTRCALCEVPVFRNIKETFGTVSSLRLDAVVGEVFSLSRTKVKALLEAGKVIVNGAESRSAHGHVQSEDVISVRGYGKFIFYRDNGFTKKDKVKIHVGIYC